MAYEHSTDSGWAKQTPTEAIIELFREHPEAEVVFPSGLIWRKTPRDEKLVKEIKGAIVQNFLNSNEAAAVAVYDLLEEKGFV